MIRLFFATLSFISRLPVPARLVQGLDVEDYVRGIVTFPFVGVVLGGISGGLFMLQPWCGAPLAALFAVLALALLTGGFHLDGLADTCDGVFSARTRERMLEIMRDSRLGTHGGLALVFVLVAKILVISELSLRGLAMPAAFAAACAAGRGCAVVMMYGHRYARKRAGQFVYRQGYVHADRYHAGACAAGGGGAGRDAWSDSVADNRAGDFSARPAA
jgi:adenosylcobinamide-GDP ribazoletransferase